MRQTTTEKIVAQSLFSLFFWWSFRAQQNNVNNPNVLRFYLWGLQGALSKRIESKSCLKMSFRELFTNLILEGNYTAVRNIYSCNHNSNICGFKKNLCILHSWNESAACLKFKQFYMVICLENSEMMSASKLHKTFKGSI